MRPTSLVDQAAQGATGIGVNTVSATMLGKIPGSALLAAPTAQARQRSTRTQTDGSWAFARVHSPGYYLLTFSKPGYQTQRYVVDAASAAAAQPLKVDLQPGQGALQGRITSGGSPVGGATLTLTDGTNTVTTSSNSRGDVGAFSVQGLSTPGAYLVTASKDGLSTESRVVNLAAGGSGRVDLKLSPAVTTLNGTVTGPTSSGLNQPLGGVSVTAEDGDVTRSSTTITSGNLVGRYRLPGLPPGTYTVTTTANGYLTQTQRVKIHQGVPTRTITTSLLSATGTVTGTVTGVQFDDNGDVVTTDGQPSIGPINGAGILLNSPKNQYKITTRADGSFSMTGVAPGTYVLSAQYSGLTTAFDTVTAYAGRTTTVPGADLRLSASTVVDDSTITGYVASAVNPNGTLTCPDDTTAGVDCVVTLTLRDSGGAVIAARTATSGSFVDHPTVGPAGSGPTGYSLTSEAGLPPGLYRITIGAKGYLPSTVAVQVPANAVAVASQVGLFPTNSVQGTVTARDPLTQGPDAATTYQTCVWAVPVNQGQSPPADCSYTPPTASACETSGQPETGYAALASDGSYRIDGLCDGTYQLYVVTTSPWFVPTPVATQTLVHGQVGTYSPHVTSLGHVLLTLRTLDPDTNDTTLASGLTGTATCGGESAGDLSHTPGGVVTIYGVEAGTSVGCTVAGNDNNNNAVSGHVGNLTVTNDSDTTATAYLVQKVAGVVGQLVSAHNEYPSKAAGGITITVTVLADYDGPTAVHRSTSVTIDANGCFEITRDTSAPIHGSGSCADVPGSSTVELPLASRVVHLSYGGGDGYLAYDHDVTFSGSATGVVHLTARPIPVPSVSVSLSAGSGGTLKQFDYQVTNGQATGAGSVDAGVASPSATTSTLTVQDGSISDANKLSPGTYTVTVSGTGFASVSTTITCAFDAAQCTASPGSLTLRQNAYVHGTITGYRAPQSRLMPVPAP